MKTENKLLSLDDCKDEVAKKRAYRDWKHMENMEHQVNSHSWIFLIKATEEAALMHSDQYKKLIPEAFDAGRETGKEEAICYERGSHIDRHNYPNKSEYLKSIGL